MKTGILKKAAYALALVAAWILTWATVYELFGKDSLNFPSPWLVLETLWDGLRGDFPRAALASLARIGIGFGAALALGTLFGVLLASHRFFEWFFGPLVLGVQCLPSICWLPVAILWLGLSERAILFVVLMGSLGSIAIATRDGLRQVPATYLRVAGTFGASVWQRLLWVSIPAALPAFVTGLKQGWSFAWRSLLAGELIYRVVGVGGLLTEARDLADYPRMFAVMFVIVGISVLIERLVFRRLELLVRARWGLQAA
jgi:NitT/TauT family transport system permease protein